MARSPTLAALQARIAALDGTACQATADRLPLGLAAIDDALPWGGLAKGALHEIEPQSAGDGIEDGASCGFAALLLAKLAAEGNRPVLWVARDDEAYAPGLAGLGLSPEQLIQVRPHRPAQLLWALEEGLRCPALAAVLGEVWGVEPTAARRLQLAARASGVTALLLNRGAAVGPAVTRWRIASAPSVAPPGLGVGNWRWKIELLRCRGRAVGEDGTVATWLVEWCDETRGLHMVPQTGDRPAVPGDTRLAG